MITPNSKLTALEVLQECGVENAEALFGTTRVRIGGISGINTPDHLINIPASAEMVEVIVGNEIYELTLSKGNKDNNKDIRTISPSAQVRLEEKGREATVKGEQLQAVKQVAKLLRDGGVYTPESEEEEKVLAKAEALNESHVEAVALAEEAKANRPRKEVKSK
jgi:hypothetical protein